MYIYKKKMQKDKPNKNNTDAQKSDIKRKQNQVPDCYVTLDPLTTHT